MRALHFIHEAAATELADKLPTLKKHDYNTIDRLMKSIASKHKITANALHHIFKRKYKDTPDNWIKSKLDETSSIDPQLQEEIENFIEWAKDILHLKKVPEFTFSNDTQDAQDNHHTGSHIPGKTWVYVKNRNLVDILRTVFHELVHARQEELNMIKPNSGYPGSPVEAMADMLAGKYIKIYGEKNHHIFQ